MNGNLTAARYLPATRDSLNKHREKFTNHLKWFVNWIGNKVYSAEDIINKHVDWDMVDEIHKRLHQRQNYYLFFHGTNLKQTRQAATKAYWILRYRPIKLPTPLKDYDANIHFAYFILFADNLLEVLGNESYEIRRHVIRNVLKEHGKDTFIRGFSEYDISKEAMMLVSESILSILDCEARSFKKEQMLRDLQLLFNEMTKLEAGGCEDCAFLRSRINEVVSKYL
ncbi:MAG: hypothetical protein LBE35_01910 [Clostridiales bacterium]|jgi:hypothetical protein|nr:hypothetical protein [Clostridiales bacterium]